VDLAVRMGKLADSSLGARYLGINPWVMVARRAYLKARHAAPRRPTWRHTLPDLQQRAGRRPCGG
jgi:DNA-binding transcriptional LysR family regulator